MISRPEPQFVQSPSRRVIRVGFTIKLQDEPGIRPFVRDTQNQYDKRKKYKFVKVSHSIQMAVRMYSQWLNVTVTEAACYIVATGLKNFKDANTSDDPLKYLDPLGNIGVYDYFQKNYEG